MLQKQPHSKQQSIRGLDKIKKRKKKEKNLKLILD